MPSGIGAVEDVKSLAAMAAKVNHKRIEYFKMVSFDALSSIGSGYECIGIERLYLQVAREMGCFSSKKRHVHHR